MNAHERSLRDWAKADPERLMPYVERALKVAEVKRAQRAAEAEREQNVE